MAAGFDIDDLYTVSAGSHIYNYWNPFVTKHDTSSFYTWEQDNLPLYDLEERTDYLWEKFGWPTSSVPGLAFAVSSTIPTHLDVSTNVFTSLQDAVDALPEILRFPTLIEVAVSGDIGELNLNNIKCEGDGALEIVNRLYGKVGGTDTYRSGVDGYGVALGVRSEDSAGGDQGELHAWITNTSSLVLSSNVSSLMVTNDEGMTFAINKHLSQQTLPSYLNIGIGGGDPSWTISDGASFISTNYGDAKSTLAVVPDGSVDVSTVEPDGTVLLTDDRYGRSGITSESDNVVGSVYGNTLRKISVANCDGPIYIRRFGVNCASGASSPYDHLHDVGIGVYSTEGLVMEDCAVTRAKTTGLEVDNSKLTLGRSFFSGRNYVESDRDSTKNFGILGNNSVINFQQDSYGNGLSSVLNVAHQDTGIRLVNSHLSGGQSTNTGLTENSVVGSYACSTGLDLKSSVVELDGVLDIYHDLTGIKAEQSDIITDSLIAMACESGMELDQSKFLYNKNLQKPGSYPTVNKSYTYFLSKNWFFANHQHIISRNSSIVPAYANKNMPDKHGEFTLAYHIGSDSAENKHTPGVELHNSNAELVHPFAFILNKSGLGACRGLHIAALDSSVATLRGSKTHASIFGTANNNTNGAIVFAGNNSTVNIAGPTHISEADAAVMAERNSTINMVPHFKGQVDQLAIDAWELSAAGNHTSIEVRGGRGCTVVDNNSTLNMRNLGHVNVHWRNSTEEAYSDIDLEGQYLDRDLYTSAGSMTFLPFVQAGGKANNSYASVLGGKLLPTGDPTNKVFSQGTVGNNDAYYYYRSDLASDSISDFRNYSSGGYCVRALNNSNVSVQNVNFITGKNNADGIFLDPTLNAAGGCNDLRIWTVGGGSTLQASHTAVSGVYPSDAGYTGPRATYFNKEDTFDASDVSFSAFSHSPYFEGKTRDEDETDGVGKALPLSSLSVLDFFGLGTSALSGLSGVDRSDYFRGWSRKRFGDDNPYGFGTSANYQNYGPYRIYVEIDPAAAALKYVEEGVDASGDTRPFQTLAQGYFLSGACSALSSVATDYFPQLYNTTSGTSSLEASGFYHTSAFIDTARFNVKLDDSASNLFANAKNASIELLGRPKMFSIYRSTKVPSGESFVVTDSDLNGNGRGFSSSNVFDLDVNNQTE